MNSRSLVSYILTAALGIVGGILFSEYSDIWGAILLGLALILLGVTVFFEERGALARSILGFFIFLSGILLLAGTLGGGGL
jgi:hypothetical protein